MEKGGGAREVICICTNIPDCLSSKKKKKVV